MLTRNRDVGDPLPTETVLAVLDAGRSNGDLLIADLGRGTEAVAAGVLDSVELIVPVCCATVPAVSATRKLAARLPAGARSRLVVRGPSPSGLTAAQVAGAVGLPLLAGQRSEAGLPSRCESGGLHLRRRSPLRRTAQAVLAELADGTRRR